MNIEPNSTRLSISILGKPTVLAIGIVFATGLDVANNPMMLILNAVGTPVLWISIAAEVCAVLWAARNLWQLRRWMNGELVGGCVECGGVMHHLDGRYGPYSVCKMCRSKRGGWH
jgi:hypothetical protein